MSHRRSSVLTPNRRKKGVARVPRDTASQRPNLRQPVRKSNARRKKGSALNSPPQTATGMSPAEVLAASEKLVVSDVGQLSEAYDTVDAVADLMMPVWFPASGR